MTVPIENRFRAVDAKDMAAFLAMLTDDHVFVFGDREPVIGKAGAQEQVAAFWSSITALHHNIQRIHRADNWIVVESVVDYERLDGRVVHVPCCDVFRTAHAKIAETHAYLDQSAVWA